MMIAESCWSCQAPGTYQGHSAILPANAAGGNGRTCLVCPKHMEQLGSRCEPHFRLWNLCAHPVCCPTHGLDCWLLAVPTRDKVYLKGSTPKWSTSENCHLQPMRHYIAYNQWNWKYIRSEFIKLNRSNISKRKKKRINGTSPGDYRSQLHDCWRSLLWWSCGTSPAESFMTLPLPGCWSLTKVCPVELRSTMDTFKGSTSAKVPGRGCSWNGVNPIAGWCWMVYFMPNPTKGMI